MRTLLRQMQDAGWLRWQSQSGRGKRGELQLLIAPESIRSEMLEQALNTGQQQNALALAQIAPDDLRTLLNPFLGGLWQNETPTLRIPYYRPLDPLVPGFLPGARNSILSGRSSAA